MIEQNTVMLHELERRVAQLELLEKTARTLAATLDLEELLNLVMETTKNVLQAEACSILLYEKETGDLVFTVALGEKGDQVKEMRIKPGQGIAGWVLQQGEPLLIPDVRKDTRFYSGVDKQTGFSTRSLIAVPLITKDRIIGVVEVLNKVGGGCFEESDKEILVDLSQQIAIAVENAQMTEELKKSKAQIEEYSRTLEQKVEQRTKELQIAYEKLQKTNQDLERSNRELKEAQAQLLQQEKLASIGQLAAGVAHEINNPIAFVHGNISIMGEYMEDIKNLVGKYEQAMDYLKRSDEPNAKTCAADIEMLKKNIDLDFLLSDLDNVIKETKQGVDRVAKIVRDLKDFSRIEHKEIEWANMNECLESTLNIIRNEVKYKVKLNKSYGKLPDIRCYPLRLNQVFLNVLINAIQAIPDKGEISIETFQKDGHVVVKISDTGIGIPEENLSRIFEPFFTTKEVGKGTGLGLSTSYQIIKAHNGKIDVSSKVDVGTTFTIELPIDGISDEN